MEIALHKCPAGSKEKQMVLRGSRHWAMLCSAFDTYVRDSGEECVLLKWDHVLEKISMKGSPQLKKSFTRSLLLKVRANYKKVMSRSTTPVHNRRVNLMLGEEKCIDPLDISQAMVSVIGACDLDNADPLIQSHSNTVDVCSCSKDNDVVSNTQTSPIKINQCADGNFTSKIRSSSSYSESDGTGSGIEKCCSRIAVSNACDKTSVSTGLLTMTQSAGKEDDTGDGEQATCDIDSFTCGGCGLVSVDESSLEDHAQCHTSRDESDMQAITASPDGNEQGSQQEHNTAECYICGVNLETRVELARHMSIHRNSKGELVCPHCNRTFTNSMNYTRHVQSHDPQRTRHCSSCSATFTSYREARRHYYLEHKKQKSFECGDCQATFHQKREFTLHRRSHTGPFVCKQCGKRFTLESNLERHQDVHTKCLSCPLCGKIVLNEQYLRRHMIVHGATDGKFKCEECKRSFMNAKNYERHLRSHNPHRQRECSRCHVQFNSRKDLRNHYKSQHQVKKLNYQCPICYKWFVSRGVMLNHQTTHSSDRNFMCHHCSRCFKLEIYLRRHVNRIHLNKTSEKVACQVCGVQLSDRRNLEMHMRRHTGERPFACPHCTEHFPTQKALTNHVLRHTGIKDFVCDQCGKSFGKRSGLEIHKVSHSSEKPYKCSVCDLRFVSKPRRKRHEISHSTEKPHKCPVCAKGFKYLYNLTFHLRSHSNESSVYTCDICHKNYRTESTLRIHKATHVAPVTLSGHHSNDGKVVPSVRVARDSTALFANQNATVDLAEDSRAWPSIQNRESVSGTEDSNGLHSISKSVSVNEARDSWGLPTIQNNPTVSGVGDSRSRTIVPNNVSGAGDASSLPTSQNSGAVSEAGDSIGLPSVTGSCAGDSRYLPTSLKSRSVSGVENLRSFLNIQNSTVVGRMENSRAQHVIPNGAIACWAADSRSFPSIQSSSTVSETRDSIGLPRNISSGIVSAVGVSKYLPTSLKSGNVSDKGGSKGFPTIQNSAMTSICPTQVYYNLLPRMLDH